MAPQGIYAHPQLKKITEAILEGQTATHIAKWAVPQVHRTAISRFIQSKIKPATENAAILLGVAPLPPVVGKHKETFPKQQLTDEDWDNCELRAPDQPIPEEVRELVTSAVIATPVLQIRENRIKAKLDRHRRFQMIVEGRARQHADVDGGASGFLALDYKGDNAVYKFDAALATAFEENEKAIAVELGQWQEGTGGQVSIQILCPAAPGGDQTPKVVFGDAQLTIEAGPDDFEEIGVIQK